METSARAGNARMRTPDAPSGLAVVQDLLNTVAGGTTHPRPDLIGDLAGAQTWSDAVLAEHGRPPQPVDEAGAQSLRDLREAVRAVLHGVPGDDHPSAQVGLDLVAAGRVEVEPLEGADAVRGLVLAEILLAQERGDWPRLKLCALRECDGAFYDRTRNRSARYHLAWCANHVNLRNSRERRREA